LFAARDKIQLGMDVDGDRFIGSGPLVKHGWAPGIANFDVALGAVRGENKMYQVIL